MDNEEKVEVFKEGLSYIKNKDIKKFAEAAISFLPDYFFAIPASSTGKYHPAYTLGDGGLVRHTRAAVRLAVELYRITSLKYTADEKDLMIVALILHDGWKSGETPGAYTFAEHPKLAVECLSSHEDLMGMLPEDKISFLFGCIETHMGQWNTDWKTKEVILRKPETICEKFVHLCDYLASRKCLEMNFEIPITND